MSSIRLFLLPCLWAVSTASTASTKESCSAGLESCTSEQLSMSAEAELELQEQSEASALQMELLQKHTNVAKGLTAKKEQEAKTEEPAGTELVTKDHNGHVCMLCGKPLPHRVDKEYTEFRTDCGNLSSATGPGPEALSEPVVEIARKGASTSEGNGFCALNFAKSCADAIANRDYLYWAKSLDLNSTTLRSNAAWDGRYCAMNGFLDKNIVALQHDFEGMSAKGKDLCKTKYAKYNIDKITFKDMMSAARYEDPTAPKQDEAEILAAWNCAMGDLGCDLALCSYSFCRKGAGTGLYDECAGWHPVKGMPIL